MCVECVGGATVGVTPNYRLTSQLTAANFDDVLPLGSARFMLRTLRTAAVSSLLHRTLAMTALPVDKLYPGTAVQRMLASRERVASLTVADLNQEWEQCRVRLLWAAGLRDLQNVAPGQG